MSTDTFPRQPAAPSALRRAVDGLLPHWSMWGVLVFLFALNMTWIALTPRFSLSRWSVPLMALVLLGPPLVLAYREMRGGGHNRNRERMLALLLIALYAGLFTQQVNLFSHLGMSLAHPLIDDRLIAWDRALGFDWNGYAAAVLSVPGSWPVLVVAYAFVIGPAVGLILGTAVWKGRTDRVNELAFITLVTAIVCVTGAALLPAQSAWMTIASPHAKELIGSAWKLTWLEQFKALRSGGPVTFDLHAAEGLATFPSFHTCLGLIILWCSRGHWLGLLAGSLTGIAIIAATPVFGGHYGVDILAGSLITAAAVLLWGLIAGRRPGSA
jgi:hypothetical protein